MPDDPRVQKLLEELLGSGATPEEVCGSCVELLPRVRARWLQVTRARAELDAMFPPEADSDPGRPASAREGAPLPVIPGYEVEAVLGAGGMGVVFKARQLRLNRAVALKMLIAGAYAGAPERARFQREAEAVASLCHANIVQIYEVGDHEGRPYFAMELVEGGCLAQKLAAGPPPIRWSAELVASLADAVAVAHGAGIVHRDLKPANVLLTATGAPKISDFGLARRLTGNDRLTWTGTAVGTPSYMAPELASGTAGPVGPAADVYGLGAVLYQLLTGRPPFHGGTALETFRQVLSDEPVPPSRLNPRVPRDLETVCLKCLQKEPQRRYPGAAALAEDLRRYLLGQVVLARPVGNWERAGKWLRRNPTVASLSTIAVLALVAGTVVSSLFAVEKGKQAELATERAGELEKQAIALDEKTRAAEENAKRAREEKEETTRILISGWIKAIGRNQFQLTSSLDSAEIEALGNLRAAAVPVRLQFLETALRDPVAAKRIGRRADWVAHAIVGCDRALRAEVEQRIVRRIQEPDAPQEVGLACARLGLAVNVKDRAWAERSAAAVLVAVHDPVAVRDGYSKLAEMLAAVSEYLPTARATSHAAQALDVFLTVLKATDTRIYSSGHLTQAVVAVSPWLDADAASRAAEALNADMRRPLSSPTALEPLAKALVAVCQRLPASAATAQVNRAVEWILEARAATPEKNKSYSLLHAQALLPLCGRLDTDHAGRVADMILAVLGDSESLGTIKTEFISRNGYAVVLTAVADQLDAPSNLRAAVELVRLLRSAKDILLSTDELRIALVSVCRRVDAVGAARVAEAVVDAVRDPKTSIAARTILAHVLAATGDRLGPAQAESLERAVVDSLLAGLTDTGVIYFRNLFERAVVEVCARPGAKSAPRVAAALTEAIRNPKTPLALLQPLAAALARVSGQLPAEEAASRTNEAVTALGSVCGADTSPLDRLYVAEAQVALWAHLEPASAAARAKKEAIALTALFHNPKATTTDLHYYAQTLVAMCGNIDPAERCAHLNSSVDVILAAARNPKSEVITASFNWATLAILCKHLDRPGIARVTDAILTSMSNSDVESYQRDFPEDVLKKVTARMGEADLRRLLEHPMAAGLLRRVILDALGGMKDRTFRNVWDYLDWVESTESGARLRSER